MRISEPTKKSWLKIFSHFHRRCSLMTPVSGNIRFMRIFAGVHWRRLTRRQTTVRQSKTSIFRAFGVRTLRLRHLRKRGQDYYTVLFSLLSPFQWTQNTWPWMTLNGHFTLNCKTARISVLLRINSDNWVSAPFYSARLLASPHHSTHLSVRLYYLTSDGRLT